MKEACERTHKVAGAPWAKRVRASKVQKMLKQMVVFQTKLRKKLGTSKVHFSSLVALR